MMKKTMYLIGLMIGAGLIILSCQKQPQEVKQQTSNTSLKDGSTGTPYQGVDQTAERYTLKAGNATLIDFDDLTPGDLLDSDHYPGVYIYPSSDEIGATNSICNGTVAIQTVPFTGPYFIFNFDDYLAAVSVESGDFGADYDNITLTAYNGLDATGNVQGSVTVNLEEEESGCLLLELTGIQGVRSVTVTSESAYFGQDYPNSIYVDNLYYESVEAVMVDIKPGYYPNAINCMNDNALIPVAILSTESFDALTIDHETVVFEGAMEWHKNKKDGTLTRHEEDVNEDGLMDLVFHFRLAETTLDCSSTIGGLTGQTYDGMDFYGQDEVMMFVPGE